MRKQHLDPARSVIAKIGSVEEVSVVTGRSISRVYKWMYPESRGGTGGFIPYSEAIKLLKHAKSKRIRLSPAEFFPSIDHRSGDAA